jgi:PadR family transcriptional regulator PadR
MLLQVAAAGHVYSPDDRLRTAVLCDTVPIWPDTLLLHDRARSVRRQRGRSAAQGTRAAPPLRQPMFTTVLSVSVRALAWDSLRRAVVVSVGQDNARPARPRKSDRARRRGAEASEPTLCRVASMASPTGFQMTLQTQAVLRVLLDHPLQEHYGLEISKAAGLASGSLYPTMARLERAGWVSSDWEQVDTHAAGRPRRRYYKLTPDGAEMAEQSLAATLERLSPQHGLRDRLGSRGFGTVRQPGWGVGR